MRSVDRHPLLLQPVSELGGRYRLAAPYFSDNWKVNNKLTLDLGLRWDYFSPYHEVQDRWSFLNPNLTNTATGTPGMLQFAGNHGGPGVSCNCRTPVHTYWKNWGPRVGVVFAANENTIFRAGVARVFSQAGGVGGRGGAYQGTGQIGFNVNANATPESTTGANAGPSFYLNNGSTFTAKGIANTDLLGKGFVYPAPPAQNAAVAASANRQLPQQRSPGFAMAAASPTPTSTSRAARRSSPSGTPASSAASPRT